MVWATLTLCCTLVRAEEEEEGEKGRDSSGQVQVRQTRAVVKQVRQKKEDMDVQMLDEPVVEMEAESTKPKKKKTPEEIEAGK